MSNYLIGSKHEDATLLPQGSNRYDFDCPLPPQLPATLDGKHGSIRYTVEATLDVPWGTGSGLDETKEQFTVGRYDDIQEFPDLMIPSESEEIYNFCCFCVTSKPVTMTVTLPATGFTPGQTIHFTVSFNNKSGVEVDYTEIHLKRNIWYKW